MKILFVGATDRLSRESLEKILGDAFTDPDIEIVRSEYQFRKRLDTIYEDRVDLVFMDVKIQWTTKNELVEPPQDVVDQGYFFRAGFRCQKLLHKVAPHQPLIIHSVGSADEYKDEIKELPPTTQFVEDTYGDDMKWALRTAWKQVRSQ